MGLETKFLRLSKQVELGDVIEGWQVCWLGGWSKHRIVFVVMVIRSAEVPGRSPPVIG
jgi:hypothetical protein